MSVAAGPGVLFTARIVDIVPRALDVIELTLRLSPADRAQWEPGAHIDLHLPNGLIRQYSLLGGDPDDGTLRIAVLRESNSRGGSTYLHTRARVGQTVQIGGPRNNFILADSPRYLFVAGGIGITPLLPMLERARANGAEWSLVYTGRSEERMAYAEDVERHADRVTVWSTARRGRFDFRDLLSEPRADTLIYACGPAPLLTEISTATATWPTESLRVEHFRPITGTDEISDQPFEVELGSDGHRIVVPVGTSLLSALNEHGIFVPSSCSEGTCGTCEIGVLAGIVAHRDSLLTEAERANHTSMFPCVSRAVSQRLVLDL